MSLFPSYITELKLPQVFRDIPISIADCLRTVSNEENYIADDEQTGISDFVDYNSEVHQNGKTLIVSNPQQLEFSLLQIDHKLIKKSGKRCDCAIINNRAFNFVEFKSNVHGYKQKDIDDAYNSAIEQLSVSIKLFRTKLGAENINMDQKRRVEAYMCTNPHFPHALATEMNYALQFKQSNNCPLYISNKMTL